MTYVDEQYITVARNNEVRHHERTMEQLRAKIAQLTKAVEWELQQHQARLTELQQVEGTLAVDHSSHPSMTSQPTLAPNPSSRLHWTQSRKYIHRSHQQPVAHLVG
jgi:hypothetical protein